MRLLLPFTFLVLFCSLQGAAQSGPGGVGNSSTNILWLDASFGVSAPTAGVTSWTDRSGAGNTVVQGTAALQPLYMTNAINGYPTVFFDNDQTNPDWMSRADNATLEGMNGLTAFCVYQLATGTAAAAPRGIMSKRNGPDNQEAYAWFLYNGGGSGSTIQQYLDIDGTGNRISSSTSYSTGTTYINGFVYHGALPSNSSDQILYDGSTAVGNGAETSTSIPNYTSNLYIGSLRGHTGSGSNTSRFNGNISELIVFNYAMGSAQRLVVNNYLAAKYGSTLATGDLYVQDNPANGNYDHDVAGIGRASATDLQTVSRGTGLVEFSGATDLNNGEYFFWGHNNGATVLGGNSDFPSGLFGRWSREWRTSEVTSAGAATDVGSVDITFDLNGFNLIGATSYLRLLVDANNNGVFADDVPIASAIDLGGGRFQFTGVAALTNGMRFTLGTTNPATLPIELLSFDAVQKEHTVELQWATASEQDNDRFTVERSADLQAWTAIGEVPGAGNSSTTQWYQLVDGTPLLNTSYYRLRQVDTDGTSTLSAVRPVHFARSTLAIYPNPTDGHFTVVLPSANTRVHLVDLRGRAVEAEIQYMDQVARIRMEHISAGRYLVVLTTDGERISAPVDVHP